MVGKRRGLGDHLGDGVVLRPAWEGGEELIPLPWMFVSSLHAACGAWVASFEGLCYGRAAAGPIQVDAGNLVTAVTDKGSSTIGSLLLCIALAALLWGATVCSLLASLLLDL